MELFIPAKGYHEAMAFTQQELNKCQILLSHVFHGLATDGLIEPNWTFGPQQFLMKNLSGVPSDGIICIPTSLGAELLLWACGQGDKRP